MIRTSKHNNHGFTILELVTAIFIIVMGLMGIIALVVQNIQVSDINKEQLVASGLAQEGLELVRNVRDNNFLSERPWNDSIGSGGGELTFVIDYTGRIDTTIDSIEEDGAILQINNDGYYLHDNGFANSQFRRLITTTQASADDPLDIQVLVRWSDRGKVFSYEANSRLENWQ